MIFAIISAVTWGTYGTFYTFLLEGGVSDLTLVALAPLALVLYFGARVLITKPGVLKKIPWKYYLGMALQGFILVNAMNYCYAQAYTHEMPVGIVSTVAFCNVLIIMIESYFLFKYKFTVAKVVSMVIALVGVSLVLNVFGESSNSLSSTGIMWTLLIPVFFGTNVTLNTFFIVKKVDTDAILFITQGFALVFMLIFQIHPVALVQDVGAAISNNMLIIFALLGFCAIPQALCYATMQETLKRIEPAIMGIVYSLDPVVALVLGLIIFTQAIGIVQILGVLCVLAAVAFINYKEGREAAKAADEGT